MASRPRLGNLALLGKDDQRDLENRSCSSTRTPDFGAIHSTAPVGLSNRTRATCAHGGVSSVLPALATQEQPIQLYEITLLNLQDFQNSNFDPPIGVLDNEVFSLVAIDQLRNFFCGRCGHGVFLAKLHHNFPAGHLFALLSFYTHFVRALLDRYFKNISLLEFRLEILDRHILLGKPVRFTAEAPRQQEPRE